MLVQERQQKIIDILRKEKTISLRKLKDIFYVSEATIRRDLSKLEQKGIIQRTHGGAILPESSTEESSILVRQQTQIKEKKKIAHGCLPLIPDNASVFLDSSSTVGHLLYLLKDIKGLTIITNGLNNAMIASQSTNANLYLSPGIVFTKTNSVLGADTIDYVNGFNCNYFIFSCSGISLNHGVMEASFEQKMVKEAMLRKSKHHILLVDHTKFEKIYMTTTCGFDVIDVVITDKQPPDDYIKMFKEHDVELIVV